MPTPADEHLLETVGWVGDAAEGCVRLIDQTLLPVEFRRIDLKDVPHVFEAIRSLRVRGAPAIGVAAAYGAVLGARARPDTRAALLDATEDLRGSRPTAVNLFWALDRMDKVGREWTGGDGPDLVRRLLVEADAIAEEDQAMCRAIGRHGAELVDDGDGILTHCNAGGLATADYGTALAVFFSAHESGKHVHIYVDETRPLLQGSRLTAWELQRRGVPCTLICDSMAAQVMKEGKVRRVVVGADRIAANGDAANKIGTYGVAVLAHAHGIPFYVAAPSSTFDLSIADGSKIPIEERNASEITHGFGRQTAPEGIDVYNPSFDVTPARLIAGIITERGVIAPVSAELIRKMLG